MLSLVGFFDRRNTGILSCIASGRIDPVGLQVGLPSFFTDRRSGTQPFRLDPFFDFPRRRSKHLGTSIVTVYLV